MIGLFDNEELNNNQHRPLAERIRPSKLEDVVGQDHLLGEGAPISVYAKRGSLPSMILWGPPGSGKTTLAGLLAQEVGAVFERMSAVEAGVRDLRDVIKRAEHRQRSGQRTILFIDEVHRFNKSQQDALLHAVERGIVNLIGATTENPSFEVNAALLSRSQVYKLNALSNEDIKKVVVRALIEDSEMRALNVQIEDWTTLYAVSAGDARSALNAVEAASVLVEENDKGARRITNEALQSAVQRRVARYDKAGDAHFDTISAFIKTVRGSDPDAALAYLALMIDAGEDALFICRRLIVLASEDIGNADPHALPLAVATFQALERIGMPEGRIPLAQCTIYLASAPKSNASYQAIEAALSMVREGGDISIPLHLRNAPTSLMKDSGYGLGYKYPHSFEQHFIFEKYFPNGIDEQKFYDPDGEGFEKEIAERLRKLWPGRE